MLARGGPPGRLPTPARRSRSRCWPGCSPARSGSARAAVALVVAAVLTGQLSIGWSNDLIDLARDRAVGREDKPLVDGRVSERTVRVACALAVVATVPLSLACGWLAGPVHLVCVAAGWAYNLGAKATPWSWLPYAVAFGGLPVVRLPDRRTPTRCRRSGCRWPARCSASARTSSTCCPTWPTTRPPASAGCRTGSARGGARWSRPRCSSRPPW